MTLLVAAPPQVGAGLQDEVTANQFDKTGFLKKKGGGSGMFGRRNWKVMQWLCVSVWLWLCLCLSVRLCVCVCVSVSVSVCARLGTCTPKQTIDSLID